MGRSTSLHRRISNMVQLSFVVLLATTAVISAGPLYAQETKNEQPAIRSAPITGPANPVQAQSPAPTTTPSFQSANPIQAPTPTPPEQPLSQPPSANIAPAASAAPSAVRPAAAKKAEVNFNFDDADIFEVIQTVFGDILKVNYMIDPRIKGRVNFRTITPVKRDEVLPLIGVLLKMNGAGFIDDKGLYRIVPLEEVPGTTPKVFVYPLQNTKAKHISALLQSIFTGAAAPATAGSFIPSAPGAAAGRPQAASASTTTPSTGGSGFNAGSGVLVAKDTKVYADEITNSLVILASPDDYKFIEETIKKLDTPPRQVMIEVLIAEVTLTKDFQFGLEWVLSNTTQLKMKPFSQPVDVNGQTGQNSNLLNATSLASGYPGFSYAATDAAGNVKALLNTMASNDL